jgi:hypothetical protein
MANVGLGKLLGTITFNGGYAKVHARGLTLSTPDTLEVPFAFPRIARPAIVAATFDHAVRTAPPLTTMIDEALRDRVALAAVGQPTVQVPLTVAGATFRSGALAERQLYDIAVRTDEHGWQIVEPHAVYCRSTWADFGIAHITDMHVARRIDRFRAILRAEGREDAARRLYNWNDRFRGFVRYANYLHGIGVLDVIVATGDNYDYQYEDQTAEEIANGGNAGFLRELILGKAPGPREPEFLEVEELRVPIFMVPGNHDYRRNPYGLFFDLHMSEGLRTALKVVAPVGGMLASKLDLSRIKNSTSYNLRDEDAVVLANRLESVPGETVSNREPDFAAKMVATDPEMRGYRECLDEPGPYLVALGPHRIAMIDSAEDVGMVTEQFDAFLVEVLGRGTEDEDAFVGGSPNCKGVPSNFLEPVKNALADPALKGGLFIVGLHAPLFNPPGDGYSYFFRETQRALQEEQVLAFLAQRGAKPDEVGALKKKIREERETWFAEDRDPNRRANYVKRKSSADHFDCGVSRGEADALTRILAGDNPAGRAADLVLAGHTHFYNEYRVALDPNSRELFYYHDFYTQNPTTYYPTRFMLSWSKVIGKTRTGDDIYEIDVQKTFIEVTADAERNASPWEMPFPADQKYMLQIPRYAQPLNSAADPAAWWNDHRPLVLQTGALGPRKAGGEYFSGFRLIAVKNNVIEKIHLISSGRLEQHNYRLDWEQAILPEEGARPYHYVERSRAVGAPKAVGVPSGIAALGATNVVYRDGEGRLHEAWRKGEDAGTTDLTTSGGDAMRAAGDPTSYVDTVEGSQVAIYRGKDNHVYSLYWSTGAPKCDGLSASVGAPKATGSPVGYVGKDGYRTVFYRAEDGHLHNLWWTGADPVQHGDITTRINAPKAAGNPVAYQQPTGEHDVFYRGVDKHIHRLFWPPGNVNHEDLSSVAQAADAVGDPSAFYASDDDSHHVFYRSADGHIQELSWAGGQPVGRGDLMTTAQDPVTGHKTAPPATDDASGDPIAYYTAANKQRHVIYRAKDGHLWTIYWTGNGVPTCIDLTAYAAAPIASDKPTAFVDVPRTHVMYRGKDDRIHEIWWSSPALLHQPPDPGGTLQPMVEAVQPVDPGVLDALRHRGRPHPR